MIAADELERTRIALRSLQGQNAMLRQLVAIHDRLGALVLQGEHAQERRDAVLRQLERHSIEARPVWKPMHLQPLYAGAPFFEHAPGQDVGARLFAGGLCLPSGSNLSPQDIERVIGHLRRAFDAADRLHALV